MLPYLDFDPFYYFFTWMVVIGVIIEGGTLFFGHSKWLVIAEKFGFILLVLGLLGEVYADKWIDYAQEAALEQKFNRIEVVYKEYRSTHPRNDNSDLDVCGVPFRPAPWPFSTMSENAYKAACGENSTPIKR